MAGAASSSSSSSSENYDVFLSFRGEDTRRNFVSHLYKDLLQKQIKTYKNDKTLEKGDEVWPALVRAIKNSYICIVVFSKDYASSTWCLKELTQILDCKQEGEIIPVFYEIEPTHVRHQTGSYQQAFKEYEKELDEETVSKWKASLKKAANFSGFDSQSKDYSDESNFIDEIVKKVLQKLSCKYPPNELAGLIGIEENIRSIESLLQKVQTIGIWGMGGIGKTTLARAVFHKHSTQYDGRCFLANIREESGKHGLDHLRKQLLSKLLDGKDILEEETSFAMSRLKCKKVFIVLDDVDDSEQLEHLIGDYDCLRSDSRLIVTTRDKHVLISKGVQEIYEVHTLQFGESIKLFSMNAFKHNHPKIGFEELSRKAVAYAGGIPLALKVLGSSLCFKRQEVWEGALKKLESRPNMKIQNVLRWSYNGLEDIEKKIFLDIACFFKGERRSSVISILNACDFFAATGIETLLDRALITIKFSEIIEMHDLIEEMGKEIVREEAINECGKRSRLWDPKEICDVLQHNKGSNLVEGMILDMTRSKDLQLNANSFTKMCNLRFFKFYVPCSWDKKSCKVYIPSHTKLIFNKLSYFHWDAYPLQSLSSTFCSERLVELHLPNSHVEKLWDGVQDTVNLRIINLQGSKRLIEFPNLSNSSNLESINLKFCVNLRSVDLSNLYLPKLNYLILSFCIKLESLLGKTPLESLKELHVIGCSSLKEFSLSSEEIMELDLSRTTIEAWPSSIGRCSKLKNLYLPNSLKNLPNELSNLRSLQKLVLGGYSELHTRNSHIILDGLHIKLDGSSVESLPTSITHLLQLTKLSIQNCSRLQHLPELPPSIKCLEAKKCENLRHVDLSISCLPMLVDLDLSFCSKLESLLSETPLKSLRNLNVNGCSSLKEFSLSSEEITVLDLSKIAIETLPSSIGRCSKLTFLYLPNTLKNLPNELSNLRLLQKLVLDDYREFRTRILYILSDGFNIIMDGSSMESLPTSITHLSQLTKLSIQNCSRLQHVLEVPPSIKWLKVKNCENLRCVDLSISCLPMLVALDLSCCLKLESLLSETPLKSLRKLNVKGCSSLKEFSLSSEEIIELDLSETAIETWPSSIGRCSKLKNLYLPNTLKNLPNELSNLRSLQKLVLGNCKELDTRNLHIILDGLQSLEALDLSGCFNLSHFLLNSGTLSRLEILKLDGSNVESLSTSITHLSQLRTLSIQDCQKLQHLPELPLSIQHLKANDCISLETISTLMELKVTSFQVDFVNCVKLDQDALFVVQAYLDFIIKQREASRFHFLFHPCFRACFPGNKIPRCFLCRETQRWITIEFPSYFDLRGFAFCIIISPNMMPRDSEGFIIDCECYFVNRETVKFQHIHKPAPNEVNFNPNIVGMNSEHVYLWYENYYFMGRLNLMEERANIFCTNFNQKVFIEFSFYLTKGTQTMQMNPMIKECGVWPILNKREHNLDLNMDIKIEGCWDIDDQRRKKFKAFKLELELGTKSYSNQNIDEFESSTNEIGVDGTGFDHVCPDELQAPTQRKELKEFIFQSLSADRFKQKSREDLTELNLTCLMHNRFNELDETIQEAGECSRCLKISEFHMSNLELSVGVNSKM